MPVIIIKLDKDPEEQNDEEQDGWQCTGMLFNVKPPLNVFGLLDEQPSLELILSNL